MEVMWCEIHSPVIVNAIVCHYCLFRFAVIVFPKRPVVSLTVEKQILGQYQQRQSGSDRHHLRVVDYDM